MFLPVLKPKIAMLMIAFLRGIYRCFTDYNISKHLNALKSITH